MKTFILLTLAAIGTALAEKPIPNPLIDYTGFQKIVTTSEEAREAKRLTEQQFRDALSEKDVVLLDARSASLFALRHIKGAINLPFTDFTEETLARVIPSKATKILIYCNNNFTGAPVSMATKALPASLNLSTQISLRAYGYENIYELGPLLDVKTTVLAFEGTEIK